MCDNVLKELFGWDGKVVERLQRVPLPFFNATFHLPHDAIQWKLLFLFLWRSRRLLMLHWSWRNIGYVMSDL